MSIYQKNNTSYGLSQPLVGVQGGPILANRAPTTSDKAPIGIVWVDQTNNSTYILTSIVRNIATWTPMTGGGGGPGIFTTVTTTAVGGITSQLGNITADVGNIVASVGNITATAGNISATAGNITANGNLTATTGYIWSGTAVMATTNVSTISGDIIVGNTDVGVASSTLAFTKRRGVGTIVLGDNLGHIMFQGYDGAALQTGAQISSQSTGAVGAGLIPANLHFWTKPNGAGVLASRLEINSAGNVTINAPDAGVGLTIVNGGITVTAGTITTPLGIGVLLSTAAGVISSLVPGAAATVLTSNGAGVAPTWQVVGAPGATPWTRVLAGGVQQLAVNHGYISTVAGTQFLLPLLSAVGDVIYITGEWPGTWSIHQNAGQQIMRSSFGSTVGVGGTATPGTVYDTAQLICRQANTMWYFWASQGTFVLA